MYQETNLHTQWNTIQLGEKIKLYSVHCNFIDLESVLLREVSQKEKNEISNDLTLQNLKKQRKVLDTPQCK